MFDWHFWYDFAKDQGTWIFALIAAIVAGFAWNEARKQVTALNVQIDDDRQRTRKTEYQIKYGMVWALYVEVRRIEIALLRMVSLAESVISRPKTLGASDDQADIPEVDVKKLMEALESWDDDQVQQILHAIRFARSMEAFRARQRFTIEEMTITDDPLLRGVGNIGILNTETRNSMLELVTGIDDYNNRIAQEYNAQVAQSAIQDGLPITQSVLDQLRQLKERAIAAEQKVNEFLSTVKERLDRLEQENVE